VVDGDAAAGARCVCRSVCDRSVEAGVNGDGGGGGGGTPACGSDGQTYGSVCQLRLFACRMQKPIDVLHQGPCNGQSVAG